MLCTPTSRLTPLIPNVSVFIFFLFVLVLLGRPAIFVNWFVKQGRKGN
jgi:hypothetical protein